MGKLDDAMEADDARGLLRAWARGPLQAEARGDYCDCDEPDLTGRKSHLCFRCDRYNLARKAEIESAMQQPHPYEVIERFRGGPWEGSCCDFCAWPKTHPLHQTG